METNSSNLLISCLCGSSKQTLSARVSHFNWADIPLCQCDTCRHHTGVLCTSYIPIISPGANAFRGLIQYTAPGSSRWFCGTCGCHIFRSSGETERVAAIDWQVSTGVIIELSSSEMTAPDLCAPPGSWKHQFEGDTGDGGISVWLSNTPSHSAEATPRPPTREPPPRGVSSKEKLFAACHCSNVQFVISRPNALSSLPRSDFSDLIYPFCSTPKEIVSNPTDDKWWLRANGTKYLAGTCACRSCRLVTGFEIQTWAFVPRANIEFIVLPQENSQTRQSHSKVPLDFDGLPPGILQSYGSSPGVLREFCPRCGATVFWHDKWRPDLIDVSVGLLRAGGARAEDWLDWCESRVSFAEEAETGREGETAKCARILVDALEDGQRRRMATSQANPQAKD